MTALDHYRDQIQQALKQAPMSQLPEPLATIAYLLACGNDANAAGLAEYLMQTEIALKTIRKMSEPWIDGTFDKILSTEAERIYDLSCAALREGAG